MNPESSRPVMICSQPPVISSNLLDIRSRVDAAITTVRQTPQNREGLRCVKELRAALRKDFEALESQRKAVYKAVIAPYEAANAAYKQLVADPVKEADELCRAFVEQTQDRIKQSCIIELKEYFCELVSVRHIPWLTFDRCPVRVDMAAAQKKDWKKERQQILDFVNKVDSDLSVISALDNSAEVLTVYIRTLDLAQAMADVTERHRQIAQARNLSEEHSRLRTQYADYVHQLCESVPGAESVIVPQQKMLQCTFTVRATAPMLRALKIYLENHQFEIVEDPK